MFIPSKDEVILAASRTRSLGDADLHRSLDFISSYNNIPLPDLRPPLEKAPASGRAVYFDDVHGNAGHELAARKLAKFLAEHP